ncbi:zf-HC2 domain-containing protein [Streptomyces sp. LP11]|uniref:Zf-HC2 domain-containing protein n=1 Tax=Streptomyces pyxinicus TaxID=2970331 RepID=A0ABT2BBM9_9ACTN|nr:zf-HC2 domain-containing protein [Streptomyces sp. LP11]MCS0605920.1 zf-HC2 domain-containing protein [Streptomyces sp. LP11]
MSGTRPEPAAKTHFAEQHLGDRLSALVDGELGHETRERVLAHLATCARCKAEADAQRALKNVFAEAAPPPLSESFLARLQGLPGGGGTDGGVPPPGGEPDPGATGVFGVRRADRFAFGYVPARPHTAPAPEDRGFRIHPVGRPDDGRSASRGLRFAFAAAGAVSLAAVALGGVTTAVPGDLTGEARGGSGTGSNVVPARSAGTTGTAGGGTATPETQRRRALGPLFAAGSGALLGRKPAAPTAASAPLLPGAPAPTADPDRNPLRGPISPVTAGADAVSPLIRPLREAVLPLTDLVPSKAPGSGLLSVPLPGTTSASPATPHQLP